MLKLGSLLACVVAAVSLACACGAPEALNPVPICASAPPTADSPVAHGLEALTQALAAVNSPARVRVLVAGDGCAAPLIAAAGATLATGPESFVIVPNGAETVVVGSDPTGAMYGALELAERVQQGDALPIAAPVAGTPDLPIRAANLFLLLPLQGETSADWWFLDQGFWTEYLDMMARARLDVLDLHGMYGLESTLFPNALLYFANTATFPDVGVPAADRAVNVAMLRTIVAMAAARGIKVGLMSYRSDLTVDGIAPPPDLTDDQVGAYTREAAADLARSVPGLWRLGFRIWESQHDASWYIGTFVAGMKDAATDALLYSRSWGVGKGSMIDIVNASSGDVVVEVKYNGEQLGPPYVITGGILGGTGWWNYSYVDYLEAPDPYTFVFQVWSGGTHRLFRHASFDRIRRTVAGMKLGAARGFTLMAAHCFFPERDDYHASPADRFSPWTWRRDELEYLMFGRLGYDPSTPESRFRGILAQRTGTDALWDAVQAAGDIVPLIQSAHTCGPDQRSFAPDLEWAGNVGYWASPQSTVGPGAYCDTEYHGPYDTMAYASALETASDWVAGIGTAKLSSLDVAGIALQDADLARAAASAPFDAANAEARDVARECVALADLGDYFGHKLRAATALAIYGQSAQPDYLATARAETDAADQAWTALAADTAYIAPFTETMRMSHVGLPVYHWSMILPLLHEDLDSIDTYAQGVTAPFPPVSLPPATALMAPRRDGPGLLSLVPQPPQGNTQAVEVRFAGPVPPGASVRVVWKEFSGLADWQRTEAVLQAGVYRALLPKSDPNGFFAVEVQGGPGVGWRYPDATHGAPYVAVSAQH